MYHDVGQGECAHRSVKNRIGFQLKVSCLRVLCPAGKAKTARRYPNKGNCEDKELVGGHFVGWLSINIGNYWSGRSISLRFLQKPYLSQKRIALEWRRGKKTPKIV